MIHKLIFVCSALIFTGFYSVYPGWFDFIEDAVETVSDTVSDTVPTVLNPISAVSDTVSSVSKEVQNTVSAVGEVASSAGDVAMSTVGAVVTNAANTGEIVGGVITGEKSLSDAANDYSKQVQSNIKAVADIGTKVVDQAVAVEKAAVRVNAVGLNIATGGAASGIINKVEQMNKDLVKTGQGVVNEQIVDHAVIAGKLVKDAKDTGSFAVDRTVGAAKMAGAVVTGKATPSDLAKYHMETARQSGKRGVDFATSEEGAYVIGTLVTGGVGGATKGAITKQAGKIAAKQTGKIVAKQVGKEIGKVVVQELIEEGLTSNYTKKNMGELGLGSSSSVDEKRSGKKVVKNTEKGVVVNKAIYSKLPVTSGVSSPISNVPKNDNFTKVKEVQVQPVQLEADTDDSNTPLVYGDRCIIQNAETKEFLTVLPVQYVNNKNTISCFSNYIIGTHPEKFSWWVIKKGMLNNSKKSIIGGFGDPVTMLDGITLESENGECIVMHPPAKNTFPDYTVLYDKVKNFIMNSNFFISALSILSGGRVTTSKDGGINNPFAKKLLVMYMVKDSQSSFLNICKGSRVEINNAWIAKSTNGKGRLTTTIDKEGIYPARYISEKSPFYGAREVYVSMTDTDVDTDLSKWIIYDVFPSDMESPHSQSILQKLNNGSHIVIKSKKTGKYLGVDPRDNAGKVKSMSIASPMGKDGNNIVFEVINDGEVVMLRSLANKKIISARSLGNVCANKNVVDDETSITFMDNALYFDDINSFLTIDEDGFAVTHLPRETDQPVYRQDPSTDCLIQLVSEVLPK